MHAPIRRVVIVGGGTAGWLSAIHFSRLWRPRQDAPPLEITVIESPEISRIGVGESTTGLFTHFIRSFTTEREFLRETQASFKLGILHRDWRNKGEFYLGPLNDDRQLGIPRVEPDTFPYFRAASVARGQPAWQHILNSQLMLDHQAPYSRPPGRRDESAWDYAFHFDTHRVGAFLRKRMPDVKHVQAHVTEVHREPGTDYITGVSLDNGDRVEGDFFVDCSGFQRLLLGGAYKQPWLSYGDYLPVNRALPFSIVHEEGATIPSYTHAWALSAGWLWQIPTQERLGCGYAYSDAFISPDEAQAEVEAALGQPIEPWGDIPFKSGRLERLWVKNCVAIGLSGAFSEPLESTSIHGQLVQLRVLLGDYLTDDFDFEATPVMDSYNRRMGQMYDDFRDFLIMHYQGGRNDSDFWRSITVNESARALLDLWRVRVPRRSDLQSYFGSLDLSLWYYTLDGVGILSQEVAQRELEHYGFWREADRQHAEQRARAQTFHRYAVDHRAYLEEQREEPQTPTPASTTRGRPAAPTAGQRKPSRAQRRRSQRKR